jgi:hypothetical protein
LNPRRLGFAAPAGRPFRHLSESWPNRDAAGLLQLLPLLLRPRLLRWLLTDSVGAPP